MGFTPRQVDEMTVWELAACAEAYRKANDADPKPPPPTSEEFDKMVAEDFYIVNPHLKPKSDG